MKKQLNNLLNERENQMKTTKEFPFTENTFAIETKRELTEAEISSLKKAGSPKIYRYTNPDLPGEFIYTLSGKNITAYKSILNSEFEVKKIVRNS